MIVIAWSVGVHVPIFLNQHLKLQVKQVKHCRSLMYDNRLFKSKGKVPLAIYTCPLHLQCLYVNSDAFELTSLQALPQLRV